MENEMENGKVKLAFLVEEHDFAGIKSFNTKKAAQMYDRFLKEHYGESLVISKIIYDEGDVS